MSQELTNARRDSRPAFTAAIMSPNPRSFIETPWPASPIIGPLSEFARRELVRTQSGRQVSRSRLAGPVSQVPQYVVPTAQARSQLARHCRYRRAVDDRDDRPNPDHQIVHRDEQRRPFDRVELALGRPISLVVGV